MWRFGHLFQFCHDFFPVGLVLSVVGCMILDKAAEQALCVKGLQLPILWQEGRPGIGRLRAMRWADLGSLKALTAMRSGGHKMSKVHTMVQVYRYVGMSCAHCAMAEPINKLAHVNGSSVILRLTAVPLPLRGGAGLPASYSSPSS